MEESHQKRRKVKQRLAESLIEPGMLAAKFDLVSKLNISLYSHSYLFILILSFVHLHPDLQQYYAVGVQIYVTFKVAYLDDQTCPS